MFGPLSHFQRGASRPYHSSGKLGLFRATSSLAPPGVRAACARPLCFRPVAGLGYAPTTDTGLEIVDAFLYIKPPGESDGCSATLPDGSPCGRRDDDCNSRTSLGSRSGEPRAPEAGEFFDFQALQLAEKVGAREGDKGPGDAAGDAAGEEAEAVRLTVVDGVVLWRW
eukprot:498901-Pleurochrysis_carterae.AAC.1